MRTGFHRGLAGVLAATVCLLAMPAAADVLVLSDGERLTGRLEDISEEILAFRATLAGELLVPVDEVRSLTTDAAYRITLADGTMAEGRFKPAGGGCLLTRDGAPDRKVDLADIVRIKETVLEPAGRGDGGEGVADGAKPPFEAMWEAGLRWNSGNTDYVAPYGRLTLTLERDRHEFFSTFLVEGADRRDFPRFFEMESEWRFFLEDGLSPFVGLRAERDTGSALDLRGELTLGLGAGRLVPESEHYALFAHAGLNLALEYYNLASLLEEDEYRGSWWRGSPFARRAKGLLGDTRRRDEELNLQLGLNYEQGLFEDGGLSGKLLLYPSLTSFGDWRARSESSLHVFLTSTIRLKLELSVDFDNEPVFADVDQWRTSIGASIQWDF